VRNLLGQGLLLAIAAAAAACGGGARATRPSALLITLDTTRADALGCYGNPVAATPNLDRLALESVLFETARTTAPITLPAHASMLTGLYPPRHGVRDNGLAPLPAEARTLAEAARQAGIRTGAVVSAGVLAERWGLAQGVDSWHDPAARAELAAHQGVELDAAQALETARSFLRDAGESAPFFLWVHLFDPHQPYTAPAEFVARAGGDPYLAELAHADWAIGALRAELEDLGLLESTWIVVVGDHGEDFGQHGEPTHALFAYDTTLRVPLLVRAPDGAGAGVRRADPVSVADVHPTLLQALGLEPSPGVDGRSLLLPPAPGRGVYFETFTGWLNYGWSPLTGWADEHGKYVHSSAPQFFDTASDPLEHTDLAAAPATVLEPYRAALAALQTLPAFHAETTAPLEEVEIAALRELGYAGAADAASALPGLLAATGRPSPHARTAEIAAFYAAIAANNSGRVAEAVARMQGVVADNPRNAYALDLLGLFLVQEQRHAEAKQVLLSLAALGGERPPAFRLLGLCYEREGDFASALVWVERALASLPEHRGYQDDRARLVAALAAAGAGR